ncbi:MAG: HDOD domain-containing protein [Bdellovibrionales bacterium]|nr:HDOD domain-containing protein [Bdellovibrionales bacterium]
MYYLIRSDHCLTERILQFVNSAYYAIPGGVADLRKAMNFLGSTTIMQLVLTADQQPPG